MAVLLLLATSVQLTVWWWVYRLAFMPDPILPAESAADPPPVTVIVCFRNEATHLEATLRGVLAQSYPHFELLAVDDNSTDASVAIVRYLQDRHPQLRLLQPGPTRPGKKDALTAGIRAARHPLLLLTDADCTPASEHWLRYMTAPLTHGHQLVLGCSPYRYRPGALAWWQRFEATYTALQYQGFARLGHPFMGVGRNLAYHRTFFTAAGGFATHAHHLGGDDDLLVNAHAVPSLTARVTDPAAWTYSEPTRTWRGYLRQKWRHQSVGVHYRPRHQLLLGLLALSHGGSYLLGAMLLFTAYWPLVVALYGLRASVVLSVCRRSKVRRFAGGAPIAIGGAGGAGMGASILLGDLLMAPYYLFVLTATALPARRW